MSIKLRKNNKKGFTLIELMVASAIFIIVMVIAIGAVLSIVDANRKAQSLQSVMTNLNFAVESMVRDMREGNQYCAPSGCSPANNVSTISFYNSQMQPTTYSFNNSKGSIHKTVADIHNVIITDADITAPEVHITSMTFSIFGNGPGDTFQPVILLLIKGQVGLSTKTQSNFQLQTLITQRLLDS